MGNNRNSRKTGKPDVEAQKMRKTQKNKATLTKHIQASHEAEIPKKP